MENTNRLTKEEGYELVRHYALWYWSQKFYTLKETMEMEDCVNEIYLKLLKNDHFSKYDPSITTKKYYICRAVFTTMVDMLRKQKRNLTLDMIDYESGSSLVDMVEDTDDRISESEGNVDRDRILNLLPDDNTNIVGILPDGTQAVMSYRTLASLIEKGYLAKDIAQMFVNPDTGNPLSVGTVSRHISAMREYALDNIVLV